MAFSALQGVQPKTPNYFTWGGKMTCLDSHANDLARFWKGEVLWNHPMARLSSLKVGGPADAVLFVDTIDDLIGLMAWLRRNEIEWWLIGRGSNILVPDAGLPGIVVILGRDFSTVDCMDPDTSHSTDDALVKAGAAGFLSKLVRTCTVNGFSGLEFATGIPGSVGGAVAMNAGGWGQAVGDLVESVTVLDQDGRIRVLPAEAISFSYRQWSGLPGEIILEATFTLRRDTPEAVANRCEELRRQRLQKQPLEAASAGSFFKNPATGSAAGRLIEEAGFKGYRVGDAMVSPIHANFIVNTGNASAAEIIQLMEEIQQKVETLFGIRLEPEVRILESVKK